MDTTRKALIILGMHRSGTSALTGVLSMLGADPGPSLLPSMQGVNPKGFWEHADVVAAHDRVLSALGSSWYDERPLPNEWWHLPVAAGFRAELLAILRRDFASSPLWILKDPRMCRLMPIWLDILREFGASPHFVICLRHPYEVMASLERRDGIHPAQSNLLWLDHLIESEQWTRGFHRSLVTYEHLLQDWRATIHHIADELSLSLETTAESESRIQTFLEPSLRHHDNSSLVGMDRLSQLAVHAYRLTSTLTLDQLGKALAPIAAEALEIGGMASPWVDQVHRLRHANAQLNDEVARIKAEVARIKATVSWRITSPLRGAWNTLRKLSTRNFP